MACETWKAKLDAYADGALAESEMRNFDSHVRSCPSCSSDVLTRVQMKRAVRAVAARRFAPRAEFRRNIEASVATKPRRSFALGWAVLAAAVILLVAGALTASFIRMRSARDRVFSEIADLHVATLASATPVDVVSTDRHTVKPWFQGKIPFAFNVPEVQNTGFTLVGGRMAYLQQAPGAQLIYDVRKHHISVFIFPESGLRPGLGEKSMFPGAANFNMETWTQGGLRYFVIGDANAADIQRLAALFHTAG